MKTLDNRVLEAMRYYAQRGRRRVTVSDLMEKLKLNKRGGEDSVAVLGAALRISDSPKLMRTLRDAGGMM